MNYKKVLVAAVRFKSQLPTATILQETALKFHYLLQISAALASSAWLSRLGGTLSDKGEIGDRAAPIALSDALHAAAGVQRFTWISDICASDSHRPAA